MPAANISRLPLRLKFSTVMRRMERPTEAHWKPMQTFRHPTVKAQGRFLPHCNRSGSSFLRLRAPETTTPSSRLLAPPYDWPISPFLFLMPRFGWRHRAAIRKPGQKKSLKWPEVGLAILN
jgi:hypothetical protein